MNNLEKNRSKSAIKSVFVISAIIFIFGMFGEVINIRCGGSYNASFSIAMFTGVLGIVIYYALETLRADCLDNKKANPKDSPNGLHPSR